MPPSLLVSLTAILKIALVLGASRGLDVTMTPPNEAPILPPFPSLAKGLDPVREWVLLLMMLTVHPAGIFLHYIASLNECLFILSSTITPFLGEILPHLKEANHIPICISPTFLFASLVAILGGIGRILCYRTLGGAFSFEVVPSGARSANPEVVKKPKLAQTGLYSFLRHPSYTTGFSCVIGAAFTPLLAGSWMKESGFLETEVGKVVVPTWLFVFGITIVFVALRIEGEDEVMKRQFGEEWLQWSRRVRYKLIPGIY